MTISQFFHYLLFSGSLAMPLGLLFLTAVQLKIGRRLGGNPLNFISVLKLPGRELNEAERFLRKTGATLLLSGLTLCLFTASVLAIIG